VPFPLPGYTPAKTAVLLRKQLQKLIFHTFQPFLFLITWCFGQNSCFAQKTATKTFISYFSTFPFPHHVMLQPKQLFCLKTAKNT
jgi:hypothetical protein